MILTTHDVSFGYRHTDSEVPVLDRVSATFRSGGLTALIGPNGSGKSTLMRMLAGLEKPTAGTVCVDGRKLHDIPRDELVRLISYVPQSVTRSSIIQVFEAMLLGRVHTLSWRVHEHDLLAATAALAEFGIESWAPRYLSELSGGQQQLVALAQAFVKHPRILLLDEPTSSLDLHREFEALELLTRLAIDHDTVTIAALHDLNAAARFADTMIVLRQGTVYAAGPVPEVITERMIAEVYGMRAQVVTTDDGVPAVLPRGSMRTSHRPSTQAAASDPYL